MTNTAVLLVLSFVCAVYSACPHQRTDLVKWSQRFPNVDASTVVTIDASTNILLDVAPSAIVSEIQVLGTLVFDNADMELKVRKLAVQDGTL
jgi:hypothetical protein